MCVRVLECVLCAVCTMVPLLPCFDRWHGVSLPLLSNSVQVDTRVGRGDYGLYHEPLERVLQYPGLSMTEDQVVNTNVDGNSTRCALIPMQARCANQWHALFKRPHCASCSVCPVQKLKRCACGVVWYCSTDCQPKHWKKQHVPDHKQILQEQKEAHKKNFDPLLHYKPSSREIGFVFREH
jgi:hypothetical protein